VEVTLEANPGTTDLARLRELRAAGVNRLSLGVQSFDDELLGGIGRIHSGRDAHRAFEAARAAGFENVNLDLMYGLPGQPPVAAMADLEDALALGPEHISHYHLTLEPGTPFHRDPPALPDEEAITATEQACRARLAEAGFERYEVSGFARPGARCEHNLNYWTFGDYLGVGPGAHGKLTQPGWQAVVRPAKRRHPQDYLRHARSRTLVAEERTLSPADLAFEFMLNALRLVDGVPASLFTARTGLGLEVVSQPIQAARERGLMVEDLAKIQATPLGLQFVDDLVAMFLPTPARMARGSRQSL
jgi:oxygen-independent coproporphyrinogen-3 oxidase